MEDFFFRIFVAFFDYTNFNVMFDLKDLLQFWSKLLFGLDSSSAETSKISNSSASSKLSSTIIKYSHLIFRSEFLQNSWENSACITLISTQNIEEFWWHLFCWQIRFFLVNNIRWQWSYSLSFNGSKMTSDPSNHFGPVHTNLFGWVHSILVGSKSFWTDTNCKN